MPVRGNRLGNLPPTRKPKPRQALHDTINDSSNANIDRDPGIRRHIRIE